MSGKEIGNVIERLAVSKKIGIDLHLLTGKYQGSRTFLVNTLAEILKLDKNNEYFIYLNDKENFFSSIGITRIECDHRENIHLRKYFHESRLFRIGINIPIFEFQDRLDIFHSQYISPLFSFAKDIVTIHDILYETHPQFFSSLFVLRSRVFIRISAQRSKKILTDSLFSKSQLVDIYKIPEQKIEVIPGGADTGRFNEEKKEEAREYIENRFGIRDFILNVGRLEPRKNQLLLVKTYDHLVKTKKIEEKLVIVGPRDFHYEPIYRYVQNNNLRGRVFILNFIGDEELSAFFKAATIFVYPSFAEGFGLPVLEAMACGIPVVASDSTSIPEIAGDSCLLINPYDKDALIQAMAGLLDSPALREDLSARGVKRASQFSWKAAAEKTIKVYNRL